MPGALMRDSFSVSTTRVVGFEGFREAIQGSHVDVMQLQPGRLCGTLTHIGIGDISLSLGSFSVGIRTQRIASDPKLIIGMLLGARDRVTHWSFDMNPGDVLVIPPGVEHDGRFHGSSSYAALRLDLADVASIFGGETVISDPATWSSKTRYRVDPASGAVAVEKLRAIAARLAEPGRRMPEEAADFWRRAIIETLATGVFHALPPDLSGQMRSATRLVRDVEHYVGTVGIRPVHISEICTRFCVSRRTLHRAFHDAVGIGPITFLQRKRLCDIHSALRDGDPTKTTIAEIALQHGFLNLGRFAGYYRALFDEYPSQTFGGSHRHRQWTRAVDQARRYETVSSRGSDHHARSGV
jgi:AraC family ethanolamine operon transcriptional activator